MHPDGVAVSLEECDELAKSEAGKTDCQSVFRKDGLAIRPTSKRRQRFRTGGPVPARCCRRSSYRPCTVGDRVCSRASLGPGEAACQPAERRSADDSLGWIYQFWQSKRKDEVNKSGEKIDSRTLSVVTQLFTEDYMVQFLLHNTIGAGGVRGTEFKGRRVVGRIANPSPMVRRISNPSYVPPSKCRTCGGETMARRLRARLTAGPRRSEISQ